MPKRFIDDHAEKVVHKTEIKTKTIDVWVYREDIGGNANLCAYKIKPNKENILKAKLVIEMPDKKIEIRQQDYNDY